MKTMAAKGRGKASSRIELERAPSTGAPAMPGSGIETAVVEAVGEDEGRVVVRSVHASHPSARAGQRVTARLAHLAGYLPAPGDRVLVATAPGLESDELYVIAVLHAARPPAPAVLRAPDGATAALEGCGLVLRDEVGRLLVRYEAGSASIAAPAGDLRLAAPGGRLVLEAGLDVAIEAARDLTHRAGRRLDLRVGGAEEQAPQLRIEPRGTQVKAPRLEVEAKAVRLATSQATVLARSIATTAVEVATHVERYELTATKLVEKAKDAFRDVTDLAQTRLGRARTLVRDVYALHARRTVLVSEEDTAIDGDKVLLG